MSENEGCVINRVHEVDRISNLENKVARLQDEIRELRELLLPLLKERGKV